MMQASHKNYRIAILFLARLLIPHSVAFIFHWTFRNSHCSCPFYPFFSNQTSFTTHIHTRFSNTLQFNYSDIKNSRYMFSSHSPRLNYTVRRYYEAFAKVTLHKNPRQDCLSDATPFCISFHAMKGIFVYVCLCSQRT